MWEVDGEWATWGSFPARADKELYTKKRYATDSCDVLVEVVWRIWEFFPIADVVQEGYHRVLAFDLVADFLE